jgi:SPP1 family phage portal protein
MSVLVDKCVNDYRLKLGTYAKMQNYYEGKTDLDTLYETVQGRNNVKVHLNLFKKFVKEQSNYLCANNITYTSKTGDKNIVKALHSNIDAWKEDTDLKICRNMIKFSEAYELCYIDKNGVVKSKILTPLDCYVLTDDYGDIELAIRFYEKRFDTDKYYDVYYNDKIDHYKNDELINSDVHYFGEVPISIYSMSDEKDRDTIYNDIKSLQDGLEIISSNILNECSDFRNSYLKLTGCKMEDTEVGNAKDLGVFELPNKDCDLDFIIKNINDSFIQNLLKFFREQIYTLGNMIDHNEELTSNSSSLALKTRLISVENAVKLAEKAMKNGIKNRNKLIFTIMSKFGKNYNYLDIDIKFTTLIPSDDVMLAQILSQTPEGVLSKETSRKQFSFVDNPALEAEKVKAELKEDEAEIGKEMLDKAGAIDG